MSDRAGFLISIHRYPVKSMMGERLDACELTERGLIGDRAYALIDASDGKVASAKHPKKWAALFNCRAVFVEPPRALPQADLPKDTGILRAAAQHNKAHVGVYASVIRGGRLREGDVVQVQ